MYIVLQFMCTRWDLHVAENVEVEKFPVVSLVTQNCCSEKSSSEK